LNLLEVKHLKKFFPITGGILKKQVANVYAVNDVSFEIKTGETLGLVGESGCGKSTLGRTILRLYEPTEGRIIYRGMDITSLKGRELKQLRKDIQIIFQDPFASLDPRMTVGTILTEPFKIHKIGNTKTQKQRITDLLELVGLNKDAYNRYPHEFSGGQRQRIGVARAIALEPNLIIADEPVSALDVSIQSQILNLLKNLQKGLNLTLLFIAHNLAVVKYISDKIAVMYLGKIVEITDADILYKNPLHPYTKALISSIPEPNPKDKSQRKILLGDVPSPINPPHGCNFHPRCPKAENICRQSEPKLIKINNEESFNHMVACHFVKYKPKKEDQI